MINAIKGYVHLLGDSTLDNNYWVKDEANPNSAMHQHSVEGMLQTQLVDAIVVNHAYDGFTTKSVLHGAQVGAVLPEGQRKVAYLKHKALPNRYVNPMFELQRKITEAPDVTHAVVISVGGNDFRENLMNPYRLLKDIPEIQKRYLQIVENVKGMRGKEVLPILMLQYRTDVNNDPYHIYSVFKIIGTVALIVQLASCVLLTIPLFILAGKISLLTGGLLFATGAAGVYYSTKVLPFSATKEIFSGKDIGMTMVGNLMHVFYQPILEYAQKERIPVLDLPNTFNPHQDLYESGIEPNKHGSRLITEGLAHILIHHNFRNESILYAKPNQESSYTGTPNNPSAWEVTYPDTALT
jgi:hypothetical protein